MHSHGEVDLVFIFPGVFRLLYLCMLGYQLTEIVHHHAGIYLLYYAFGLFGMIG